MRMLAGDIGGTNTRLVLAEESGLDLRTVAEKSYASADYAGLEQVIDTFLSGHDVRGPVQAACFAVAGPVVSGTAKVTNLPWVVSESELTRSLQIPRVKLINDFVGVAHGIESLGEADVQVLYPGQADDENPVNRDAVIVGAGTGFGGAHRVWINGRYYALPSEMGHAGFAPANERQDSLLAWLRKEHVHVSQETLLSGVGIGLMYRYLREVEGLPVAASVEQAIREGVDPAQWVTDCALGNGDEICRKAVELFVDVYGNVAGNVALHYYPVGEFYVAGGIAPKIREYFSGKRFIDAFLDKGPLSSGLEKVAVKLVLQEKVGLLGALACARVPA